MKTMTKIMVIVAILALVSVGGVGVVPAPTTPPVDHYKCYSIRPPQKFDFSPPLRLSDQFEDEQVRKLISRLICAPVSTGVMLAQGRVPDQQPRHPPKGVPNYTVETSQAASTEGGA